MSEKISPILFIVFELLAKNRLRNGIHPPPPPPPLPIPRSTKFRKYKHYQVIFCVQKSNGQPNIKKP